MKVELKNSRLDSTSRGCCEILGPARISRSLVPTPFRTVVCIFLTPPPFDFGRVGIDYPSVERPGQLSNRSEGGGGGPSCDTNEGLD